MTGFSNTSSYKFLLTIKYIFLLKKISEGPERETIYVRQRETTEIKKHVLQLRPLQNGDFT